MRRALAAFAVASMLSVAMAGTGVAGAARTGGPSRAWSFTGTTAYDSTTPACAAYGVLIDQHQVYDLTYGALPRQGSAHLDLCVTRLDIGLARPLTVLNAQLAGTFTMTEPDGRHRSGTVTGTAYVPSDSVCPDALTPIFDDLVLTPNPRHPDVPPDRNFALRVDQCSYGVEGAADPITGTLGWKPAA